MWVNRPAALNLTRFFKKSDPRHSAIRNYLKSYWGIQPSNIAWYEKAVRHKSLIGTGKFCHNDCNERLELLGDAVLDTVITEYLFYRFPDAKEGELTKIRSRIVNRQMLGHVGMKAHLDQMIEARIGSDDSMDKIVGNALEAWLGAIYLDKGFLVTRRCITDFLLKRYIDLEETVRQSSDFKSMLIEWAQQSRTIIEFRTTASEARDQFFLCTIMINGEATSEAEERSKKKAEQEAARIACQTLQIN